MYPLPDSDFDMAVKAVKLFKKYDLKKLEKLKT